MACYVGFASFICSGVRNHGGMRSMRCPWCSPNVYSAMSSEPARAVLDVPAGASAAVGRLSLRPAITFHHEIEPEKACELTSTWRRDCRGGSRADALQAVWAEHPEWPRCLNSLCSSVRMQIATPNSRNSPQADSNFVSAQSACVLISQAA
jgi:hypothetical protein